MITVFVPLGGEASCHQNWTSSGEPWRLRSNAGSRPAKYARRFSPTSIVGEGGVFGVRLTKNGKTLRRGWTMESSSPQCSDVTRTRSDFDNRRRSSDYFRKSKSEN